MRVKHHGDLEGIFMMLAEIDGTFPLWEDPYGGPPEPTPLQWRADQMSYIESVPYFDLVVKYFNIKFALYSEKVQYKTCSESLSEFNLDLADRTHLKIEAKIHMNNIEVARKALNEIESKLEFKTAIQKISELRHQGKLLKFSEWMRT